MALTSNAEKLQAWLNIYKLTAEQYRTYLATQSRVVKHGAFADALQELVDHQRLLGVTADYNDVLLGSSLYRLSIDSATPELLTSLLGEDTEDEGEAIAYNPDDNHIYHITYRYFAFQDTGFNIFEKINVDTGEVTLIPLSNNDIGYAPALTYIGGAFLLSTSDGVWNLTVSGNITQLADDVSFLKGLAKVGDTVYTLSRDHSLLQTISITSGELLTDGIAITSSGNTVQGATGLTNLNGTLYAILKTNHGRKLVTLNSGSGVATTIGDIDFFAGLASNNTTLWAIAGVDTSVVKPTELYTMSTSDASVTLFKMLNQPLYDNSETVSFNSNDGLVYHLTYRNTNDSNIDNTSQYWFETININTLEKIQIELSGDEIVGTPLSLAWDGTVFFFSTDDNRFYSLSTDGEVNQIGSGGSVVGYVGLAAIGSTLYGIPAGTNNIKTIAKDTGVPSSHVTVTVTSAPGLTGEITVDWIYGFTHSEDSNFYVIAQIHDGSTSGRYLIKVNESTGVGVGAGTVADNFVALTFLGNAE